jgi:hypothetical protein
MNPGFHKIREFIGKVNNCQICNEECVPLSFLRYIYYYQRFIICIFCYQHEEFSIVGSGFYVRISEFTGS